MNLLLVLAAAFLGYSNGANDNFSGVASLFGSRMPRTGPPSGGQPHDLHRLGLLDIRLYVVPLELVFGGAPIINVLLAMILHPPKAAINPLLYVGFLLASVGAAMVLYFRPTA